jgi:pullulanase/glycogen debranching enzyme
MSLWAEMVQPRAIYADVAGIDGRLDVSAYRLTDGQGQVVPLSAVLPNTATKTLIVPARDLDLSGSYTLSLPGAKLSARVRPDGWFRTLYSDKPLGATIAPDGASTHFGLFSPRANAVTLYLYDRPDASPTAATRIIPMTRDASGVWEARVEANLAGTYYDFTVDGPKGNGLFFYSTHKVHISDPYARAQVEADGKSRVMAATKPVRPLAKGIPKLKDVVAYEVHIEDFTRQLPVKDALKGSFEAFVMPGLRNGRGEKIGFDHLVDLGINVVHLLPVQEFLHYRKEEWQPAFLDDPELTRLGVNAASYEWGYRTTHAFAIENTYRPKGSDYGAERAGLRDLVQAFHDKGIAVIVDIVPNHTGENMDGRNNLFNFNVLDRDYCYRTNDAGEHIGVFGNEVKTEDRPMTQRWLIDQAKALIAEFGIDGFRIDLAGQIDAQTLLALRAAVGPDVLIYGEPWIDVSDPRVRAQADWDWYKEDAPITFFQDSGRDALIGSPFRLEDKARDRGYAGGNTALRAAAQAAIANDWPEEATDLTKGIAYIDIHDNWTLADRFAKQDWNGLKGIDAGAYRVAAGLFFTTLGPLVMHGGSEMIRSKGLAPLGETVRRTEEGPIHFKGRSDTYNVRTPNEFVWSDLGTSPTEGAVNDYRAMHAWWRGLIAFRMSPAGAVFRVQDRPPADYITWLLPDNPALLGYLVGGKVLVLANVSDTAAQFDGVHLPKGRWRQIADGKHIDPVKGLKGPNTRLTGGLEHSLPAPATSVQIWVRADD